MRLGFTENRDLPSMIKAYRLCMTFRDTEASRPTAPPPSFPLCTKGVSLNLSEFVAASKLAQEMRISPFVRAMLSRPQEVLIHANPLACPPTLQYRHLPRLSPYSAVERSPVSVSPLPQSRGRSLGDVPLSTGIQTLPLQRLWAY